jgi:hypothetical protein
MLPPSDDSDFDYMELDIVTGGTKLLELGHIPDPDRGRIICSDALTGNLILVTQDRSKLVLLDSSLTPIKEMTFTRNDQPVVIENVQFSFKANIGVVLTEDHRLIFIDRQGNRIPGSDGDTYVREEYRYFNYKLTVTSKGESIWLQRNLTTMRVDSNTRFYRPEMKNKAIDDKHHYSVFVNQKDELVIIFRDHITIFNLKGDMLCRINMDEDFNPENCVLHRGETLIGISKRGTLRVYDPLPSPEGHLLTLSVLASDGYFKVNNSFFKEPSKNLRKKDVPDFNLRVKSARFFRMVSALPFELQTKICKTAFGKRGWVPGHEITYWSKIILCVE